MSQQPKRFEKIDGYQHGENVDGYQHGEHPLHEDAAPPAPNAPSLPGARNGGDGPRQSPGRVESGGDGKAGSVLCDRCGSELPDLDKLETFTCSCGAFYSKGKAGDENEE